MSRSFEQIAVEGELARAENDRAKAIIYCLIESLGGEATISDEQLRTGLLKHRAALSYRRDDYNTGIIITKK